jgi:hypothetical protein
VLELQGLQGLKASVEVVVIGTRASVYPIEVALSSFVFEDLAKIEWIRARYGCV